jgi:hypothetical protein
MAFIDNDRTKPVKMVINGKAYNTATASLIFYTKGEDEPIETGHGLYLPGAFELYRNRHGVFFIVKRDVHRNYHDDYGFEDELRPISDKEALGLMEKYCQDEIEHYFGEIPEAGDNEVRVALRLPYFLNEKAKKIAKEKNLSLNVWLNRIIKAAVDMEKSNEA